MVLPGFCSSAYPDSWVIKHTAIHPCAVEILSSSIALVGFLVCLISLRPRLKHAGHLRAAGQRLKGTDGVSGSEFGAPA